MTAEQRDYTEDEWQEFTAKLDVFHATAIGQPESVVIQPLGFAGNCLPAPDFPGNHVVHVSMMGPMLELDGDTYRNSEENYPASFIIGRGQASELLQMLAQFMAHEHEFQE